MNVCKSTIVWSAVLIILSCNVDVDAAKASRRGGTKQKTPNYDHVALTYGHGQAVKNTHHKPVQHQQVHQVHQTQSHHQPVAPIAPSAPVLPPANTNNNKPVGWNVPHNAPEQPKTVSNTHSALPYPQNPPPYAPNPPPYAQNTGFNAHPQAAGPPPAYPSHAAGGPPPAYSPNPSNGFNAHPADHPPAYQHGSAYPMNNGAGSGYPQQQYNPNQAGAYPGGGQPSYVPNAQQPPVINNFYGQPGQPQQQQTGGSSGGGFLQTALAAGAGSLAGNALYGALKPDSEHKTIVIHENNNAPAPAVPAPVAPVAPAAPAPAAPAPVAPVGPGEVTTAAAPLPAGVQTVVQQPPQTEMRSAVSNDNVPLAPIVPLAPLPDQSTSNVPLSVPLAPLPTVIESSSASTHETTTPPQNQSVTNSSVPLASFPNDPSSQAQKGSATSFALFNISVYTIMSIFIVSMF